MAIGRPTLYDPTRLADVREWCAQGCTSAELAEKLSVSLATVKEWMNVHPEFSAAVKSGKDEADERVERSLYKRANGYEHEAVKIMAIDGEVVQIPYIERYPPSDTAAIFWLKNRQPQRWRDLKHTELTGKDGGAVQVESTADLSRLTDAELDLLIALRAKLDGNAH